MNTYVVYANLMAFGVEDVKFNRTEILAAFSNEYRAEGYVFTQKEITWHYKGDEETCRIFDDKDATDGDAIRSCYFDDELEGFRVHVYFHIKKLAVNEK